MGDDIGTETGPSALNAVADAMSSPVPGDLDAALAGLGKGDWARLATLIGEPAAREASLQQARGSDAKRGRVILLPGIMGTDLAVSSVDGLPSVVWFRLSELVEGGLSKLAVPLDGKPAPYRVVTGGLMKLYYLRMQLQLAQNWDVQLFPYDWRLDIDELADDLAKIVGCFRGTPTHLVAHSMGGLVSRAMIRSHPAVWEAMRVDGAGGRLVMLGTPNRGSFMPVLAFTGRDPRLRFLAMSGALSSEDLGRVVATFPGLYQMLPAPGGCIDAAVEEVCGFGGWPADALGFAKTWLARAGQFAQSLERIEGAERMVYVAGYGHRTVDAMEFRKGKVRWHRSRAGDGTVPHGLGLLPGVPTFWTTARHGALPKDRGVLLAIDDLLLRGTTDRLLGGEAPPVRGEDDDEWTDDDRLVDDSEIARLARLADTSDETALLRDLVPIAGDDDTGVEPVPVCLEVEWADIGKTDAGLVAVGHYQDLYPTAAEAALDLAMSGTDVVVEDRVLHGATARGILTGRLGEINLFPWWRTPSSPASVLVAGLGRPGRFGLAEHRMLMRNLLWVAGRVPESLTLATVLFGTGVDNMTIPEALQSLLGALDASVLGRELRQEITIRVVEHDLGRARTIHRELRRLAAERDALAPAVVTVGELLVGSGGVARPETALEALLAAAVRNKANLADALTVDPSGEAAHAVIAGRLAALDDGQLVNFEVVHCRSSWHSEAPTRLSILVHNDEIRVSAISDIAVISERDTGLKLDLFKQLVDLTDVQVGNLQQGGTQLSRLTLPTEFRSFLQRSGSVIIEVDRHTAAVPWEVMCREVAPGRWEPLGLSAEVTRQLRTTRTPPQVRSGRSVLERALVIGDPGSDNPSLHLRGAHKEATLVAGLLSAKGVLVDELVGYDQATLPRVLHHLLSRSYDLVHYAGHGTFVADGGEENGWLLAGGLLTGRHLDVVEHLPALVVANACYSSRVSTGLPGLADTFIGRGVHNLLGTARTVDDSDALDFATKFYSRLLEPDRDRKDEPITLSAAVHDARNFLRNRGWDAYELYGDSQFRFWLQR